MRGVSPSRHSERAKSPRGAAEKPFFRLAKDAFAGAIDQAQTAGAIEGEDRDVNLFHDFAQQRGGLESAEPLPAQRFAERVHFPEHFAEHVFTIGAAGADGKISLAQGGEKIGKRAQRKHDAALRGERKTEPGDHHHDRQSPLQLRREIASPQKYQRDGRAAQPRGQGQK